MRKLTVVAVMVFVLALAGVASAERGNIGGIGATGTNRVVVSPMERGNIGGIGTNDQKPIWVKPADQKPIVVPW